MMPAPDSRCNLVTPEKSALRLSEKICRALQKSHGLEAERWWYRLYPSGGDRY